MVVVKLGGSLQSTIYIKKWIRAIELKFNSSFILIFGGGKHADKIRLAQKEKNYDDYRAHQLAIKAMKKLTIDHFAYLKNFSKIDSLDTIKNNQKKRKLLVWLPSIEDVDDLKVSKNWDSTSDSIALAIANKTNSPLLLVKSVKFNSKKYLNSYFLKEDLLDKDFLKYKFIKKQNISIVSKYNFYKLKKICNDFSKKNTIY